MGHDLPAVSRDAGHADINVTFRIYTHVMSLHDGDRDRERLRVLVNGGFWVWAPKGTGSAFTAPDAPDALPQKDEKPHEQGLLEDSWGGLEPPIARL